MPADRPTAAAYRHFVPITTRWMDNDVYGHVNNVTYYSYFDSAANAYLIEHGLDIHASPVIGLVVESACRYHAPVAYPARLRAGVRVDRLGTRAVTYGIPIFVEGATPQRRLLDHAPVPVDAPLLARLFHGALTCW